MTQEKNVLRAHFRALRNKRIPDTTEADALLKLWRSLCHQMLLPDSEGIPTVFFPTAHEPDVRAIVENSRPCLLPALVDDEGHPYDTPRWALYESGSDGCLWKPERAPAQPRGNVMSPTTIARSLIVLVPCLAVDLSGTRLGQGGGWYDRVLPHVPPHVPIIAVAHDEAVLPAGFLPRERHDIPVHAFLTPTRYAIVNKLRDPLL
ncbi:5-formyltetrahydrofolate cyclo-ligase [Schaalia sp. lx-100]|uniref:5-formyltetrahydrofolate cyclo-ligase n=1 Tax=Schaalia sp. lx-100 TaxID=2899081 RepID=UPI001E3DDDB6|nr:5-formyltetrahydrofolate cyclo-ligase [Schaalia sp. lx-100]